MGRSGQEESCDRLNPDRFMALRGRNVDLLPTRMLKDIGRAKRVTATLELERSIHMGSMADLQEELRKRQERLEREAARHQVKIVP